MHFVTGGYFNGKSKWVREQYGLLERDDYTWISAYKNDGLNDLFHKEGIYIIEGIEVFLRKMIEQDIQSIREQIRKFIVKGLAWESACKNRELIMIGTDISKGIVPIDKKDRLWRDMTGWVYQDIVSQSEKVDVIWYGISSKLK